MLKKERKKEKERERGGGGVICIYVFYNGVYCVHLR